MVPPFFCYLFVLEANSDRRYGLGDQRAILVLRLGLDEAHATPILENARVGREALAGRAADERAAEVDRDHADRLRVQRAGRGAQRDVEQRHDDAAVRGAEAVGELRLDRQREPRRALAERVGLDFQVLDEGNFLLVFPREVDVHTMVIPPSTAIACPVMCRPASEASSTARPFRSSSLPRRRFGVRSTIAADILSNVARVIFDGKNPGQIAFTVMPCTPHSAASWRVRPTTPCLVAVSAAVGAKRGSWPISPAIEATLTMRPHFAGIIDLLATICVSVNRPLRLTLTSLSHASSGCSSALAPQVAPALFTRMSTRPNFFRISSATGAMA